MSMTNRIRQGIEKQKNEKTSEQELRDLLNDAASKSLKQFIQRISSGEIPIDNMADFARVLGVYKEINEISSAMDGKAGQAMLPEVDLRQERVLNELETEGMIMSDEEGIDVSAMSTEEVAEMIRQMDIAQNKANEEAF